MLQFIVIGIFLIIGFLFSVKLQDAITWVGTSAAVVVVFCAIVGGLELIGIQTTFALLDLFLLRRFPPGSWLFYLAFFSMWAGIGSLVRAALKRES